MSEFEISLLCSSVISYYQVQNGISPVKSQIKIPKFQRRYAADCKYFFRNRIRQRNFRNRHRYFVRKSKDCVFAIGLIFHKRMFFKILTGIAPVEVTNRARNVNRALHAAFDGFFDNGFQIILVFAEIRDGIKSIEEVR